MSTVSRHLLSTQEEWGHKDEVRSDDGVVQLCKGFCSVPVHLQSVQRAELWWLFLLCRASASLHLGVDNLNVVRHVGRLLDGVRHPCPSELVKDGDFILLIDSILRQRERDTVRVTKVKRHADEDMVQLVGCESLTRLRITRRGEAADCWSPDG